VRDDYSDLTGHRFPGGQTRVPFWMNHLWRDSVLADVDDRHVHPMLVYYAAVEASGVTFQDMFDLMDASADSGVVVGEQKLEFARPILVDQLYEVEGGITEVVRKQGARAGVFDMFTFVMTLREPAETTPAATSTMTFIFPRREAAA
jgi:hypothetical protein